VVTVSTYPVAANAAVTEKRADVSGNGSTPGAVEIAMAVLAGVIIVIAIFIIVYFAVRRGHCNFGICRRHRNPRKYSVSYHGLCRTIMRLV